MVADCPSPGNPSRKSSWKRGRQAGQLSRLHTEPCRWSSGSRWGAPPTEGPRLRDGALLGSQADSGRLHPSSGEPSPSVQDLSLPESHQTPRLWSLGQKDFRLRPHASLQGGTHGWCSCWVPPLDQTVPPLRPQGAGLQEGCCTYRQQVRIPGRETGATEKERGCQTRLSLRVRKIGVRQTTRRRMKISVRTVERGWNLELGVRAQPRGHGAGPGLGLRWEPEAPSSRRSWSLGPGRCGELPRERRDLATPAASIAPGAPQEAESRV